MKKKIEWLTELTKDRQDSVWYGGAIARIDYGKIVYYIDAIGDRDIAWIGNGNEPHEDYVVDKNNYAGDVVEWLEEHKIYTDKDLNDNYEKLYFNNNNWYELNMCEKDENGKEIYSDYLYDIVDVSYDDDFSWLDEIAKADLEEIEEREAK